MIRTVADLRRALDAYPDDLPFDAAGFVIDNGGTRNAVLTLETYDLPEPVRYATIEERIARAARVDRERLNDTVPRFPGEDHLFEHDPDTVARLLNTVKNLRVVLITGTTREEKMKAFFGDDDA